jgi:hypothetical protein
VGAAGEDDEAVVSSSIFECKFGAETGSVDLSAWSRVALLGSSGSAEAEPLQNNGNDSGIPCRIQRWNPTFAHRTRKDGAPGIVTNGPNLKL